MAANENGRGCCATPVAVYFFDAQGVGLESNKFLHRRVLDQVLRAAGRVNECRRAHVDAKVVIERGDDFLEMAWAVLGILAEAIRAADRLARAHATAGEQGAADRGPVVAS